MPSRDTYIVKMKQQLDELNNKVTELEGAARTARAEARDGYRAQIDKLREQSRLALSKLDELAMTGESTWEAMAAEMDKVRDAFVHAYHDFKARL